MLEIGSGGGRDARLMESLGLRVRRTDITPGLRRPAAGAGRRRATCSTRSSTTCPSPEGPYDAVWANASLLHVRRDDLPTVLARLAAVTRPGGVLRVSLKEGDGDGWSTHGSIRHPRHFTYWRADDAVVAVVAAAGWSEVPVRSGVAGHARGDLARAVGGP